MLSIDARLSTIDGKGVGRWRLYYRAADMRDAAWASRDLVPKCQVRVRDGREVVFGPCRAEQLQALHEIHTRLEYLRHELRAERLSWSEVAELQSLADHIEDGDVELLEAAGVPEFSDVE